MFRNPPDEEIARLLSEVRTIAVVGWSAKPARPSHRVTRFLVNRGYRVFPVNPGYAGDTFDDVGEVYAALEDIGEPIDMVDIFRRPDEAGAIVDDAIRIGAKAVWMQLGVVDEAAAERAQAAGLIVVMDRCPAIEMPRLGLSGPA
ncbi:MAG: CoA-binding protein [Alphaproteobacteria bacterium]|nr:MAG: CoA-binding protein [Alphaproteobacteria bacterium]